MSINVSIDRHEILTKLDKIQDHMMDHGGNFSEYHWDGSDMDCSRDRP